MPKSKTAKKARTKRMSKEQLAARERAIVADIKAGVLSYRQIAKKHGVSLPTVNNKARKAGISRGRRKGARILVAGPVGRKVARKTAAQKKVVRKKAARKAVRRKAARKVVARRVVRKKVTRAAARRPKRKAATRRAPRAAATRRTGNFGDAFRKLVLAHFPGISLARFDRLTRMVQAAVR